MPYQQELSDFQSDLRLKIVIDLDDGLRLRLWIAATNGPTVYPLGDTYERGQPWWNYVDRGKLLIRPPERSLEILQAETSSGKSEGTGFCLQSISFCLM
jgi:hypothetical protein